MAKPMVTEQSVFTEAHIIHCNPATIAAFPQAVAAGATQLCESLPIVVPMNEFWNIVTNGFRITVSATGFVIDAAACIVRLGSMTQALIQGTGPTGESLTFPDSQVPMQFSLISANNFQFVASLQGVELAPGDSLIWSATLRNNTAGALNITNMVGSVRYRPFYLVSESAVAQIQVARSDFGLDARLRAVR